MKNNQKFVSLLGYASCAPDASNLQRCKIIYCPHPVGSTEGPEDDFEKENPVYDF